MNGAVAVGTPAHILFNIIHPHKIIPVTSSHATSLHVGCELSNQCSEHPHYIGICQKTQAKKPVCLDELHFITVYNTIAEKIDSLK
jgi:hypothetical protein